MTYKPAGYTSVAPYLLIKDADTTLRFIEQAFGGQRLRIMPREDGSTQHAEIRIDDTVVMMGEIPDGPAAHVHIYVVDVEATFTRALAAGGTVIHPLTLSADGDHRGGIADPSGTVWWVTTPGPGQV
ncbi:MAG: VOC family protein [Devosia sp.]